MQLDDPLLNLATILTAGIVVGEIVARIGLPKVTGWIGTGMLLRALALPGLEPESLTRFSPFTDFVLGFIAFTVGATLHLPSLRNATKRLTLLMIGEAVITPAVVYCALTFVGGLDRDAAVLLAAVSIAGAPGTTVIVVREARARGVLSRTLIAGVGLVDMVAVAVFVFGAALLRDKASTVDDAIRALGGEFGGALAIGLGCAATAVLLTRRVVGPAFVGPLMVAVIFGAWGLAGGFGVSSILACMFAGIALSNIKHDTARTTEAYLQPFGGVLFAGFYTIVGLRLDFSLVIPMAAMVGLCFAARLLGKALSSFVSMSIAGVTRSVRNYLGLALLPHGGVAVGLIFFVQAEPAFAEHADVVGALGLAALAVNQLLGPSGTRYALARAGEVGRDRPRLLDFLEEQHIVLGLRGDSRRIIETLADRLYATTAMTMPKADFVAAVLERESEGSTCLGRGIMIPHAIVPGAAEVRGVLGLSADGVAVDAPDGRPVHAVVLLAAPERERDRHLQILAAFATAFTKDDNLREQLFHARSAAHAYDIIHARDSEDLNYYLDEAIEQVHRPA